MAVDHTLSVSLFGNRALTNAFADVSSQISTSAPCAEQQQCNLGVFALLLSIMYLDFNIMGD